MKRFTNAPFPSYSYVPGRHAHPLSDADGHSFGQPEPRIDQFDETRWQTCQPYLFGIDLFNAGFYWEAHEQWEAVWKAAGRSGPTADFLKALIKLAAAGVKLREGRPDGVRRHATRAATLFLDSQRNTGNLEFVGLVPAKLAVEAEAIASEADRLTVDNEGNLDALLPVQLNPGGE